MWCWTIFLKCGICHFMKNFCSNECSDIFPILHILSDFKQWTQKPYFWKCNMFLYGLDLLINIRTESKTPLWQFSNWPLLIWLCISKLVLLAHPWNWVNTKLWYSLFICISMQHIRNYLLPSQITVHWAKCW